MHGSALGSVLRLVTFGTALVLGTLGCGRSGAEHAQPAPAAADAPQPPPAVHPPTDAQVAPKFAAGQGPRIQGTIALDPQFAAAAAGHPLLVILRSQAGGGMPIAVLKLDAPVFPVSFDLGSEHAPLQTDDTHQILGAENKLFARLAVSGSMLGGPEDIESAPVLVRAGGPAVSLTLDHRRGP